MTDSSPTPPLSPVPEEGPERVWTCTVRDDYERCSAEHPHPSCVEVNRKFDALRAAVVVIPVRSAATPSPAPDAEGLDLPPVPYGQHEREVMALLAERDEMHEWADRLALAIAPIEVIGEHSSANNPWQNALDHVASPAPDSTGGERDEWNGSFSVPRRVGIYRNHRHVGSALFDAEDDADAFHRFINAEPAAGPDRLRERIEGALAEYDATKTDPVGNVLHFVADVRAALASGDEKP